MWAPQKAMQQADSIAGRVAGFLLRSKLAAAIGLGVGRLQKKNMLVVMGEPDVQVLREPDMLSDCTERIADTGLPPLSSRGCIYIICVQGGVLNHTEEFWRSLEHNFC